MVTVSISVPEKEKLHWKWLLTSEICSDGVEIDIHQLSSAAEFQRLREILDQTDLEISVL